MLEGTLPFCYLGVPLHSKKLKNHNFRPLVDKIMGRLYSLIVLPCYVLFSHLLEIWIQASIERLFSTILYHG